MASFLQFSSNNSLGGSDLSVYVTEPIVQYVNQIAENIDEAIQNALDKVVDESGGIQYEPKPLNEISTSRPNTGDLDMNDKRLVNLATLPGLTIEDILATPNVATTVQTASNLITANLVLNTAYCGPLFSTMNVKGKIITNAADPELIEVNDPSTEDKIKQVPTVGFMNSLCITTVPEDRENYYAIGRRIYELGDAKVYTDEDVRTLPDELEPGKFNVDPSLVAKYEGQACNLKTIQNTTVSLDVDERSHFVAQGK